MGKRGAGGGSKSKTKSSPTSSSSTSTSASSADSTTSAALVAGLSLQPLPPNKRHELNKLVDKLRNLTANFKDEPFTPVKLWDEFEEIHALVAKIRELEQCNMNRRLRGRLNQMKCFVEWLEKLGAQIDGVEMADFGDQGLGLRATKDLKLGDSVISIPRKAMMSSETARNSSIGPFCEKDPMLVTMENVTLALHLLIEKNSPASFWEPYINVLPHTYTTVLYFTPDEFRELKGSPAFEDALKQYKSVARQYAYFYNKFKNSMLKDYFTYEEYRWAVSSVMTRQNKIPTQSSAEDAPVMTPNKTHVTALIPFWDMANHEQGGEISTDFDLSSDCSKCMAGKEFAGGEQFTIFYGSRSNADFLVHNGFAVGANESDCLRVKLGIARTDPLSTAKVALCEKLVIPSSGLFTLAGAAVDRVLLAFLRVICVTDRDKLAAWAEGERSRDLLDETLTSAAGDDSDAAELDRKAHAYMATRAALLTKSYPTSVEDDAEILKKTEISQKTRFCVMLRKREKEILAEVVQHCQSKMK